MQQHSFHSPLTLSRSPPCLIRISANGLPRYRILPDPALSGRHNLRPGTQVSWQPHSIDTPDIRVHTTVAVTGTFQQSGFLLSLSRPAVDAAQESCQATVQGTTRLRGGEDDWHGGCSAGTYTLLVHSSHVRPCRLTVSSPEKCSQKPSRHWRSCQMSSILASTSLRLIRSVVAREKTTSTHPCCRTLAAARPWTT